MISKYTIILTGTLRPRVVWEHSGPPPLRMLELYYAQSTNWYQQTIDNKNRCVTSCEWKPLAATCWRYRKSNDERINIYFQPVCLKTIFCSRKCRTIYLLWLDTFYLLFFSHLRKKKQREGGKTTISCHALTNIFLGDIVFMSTKIFHWSSLRYIIDTISYIVLWAIDDDNIK